MEQITTSDELIDFLTLPGYRLLAYNPGYFFRPAALTKRFGYRTPYAAARGRAYAARSARGYAAVSRGRTAFNNNAWECQEDTMEHLHMKTRSQQTEELQQAWTQPRWEGIPARTAQRMW
jgi:hypothetical protein